MLRAVTVWGVWAALTAAGVGFVAAYGRNCPYMDEWTFLAAYAGDEDVLTWAWAPHFEHRYPLGRLLYLGLFRLTGDLRAGMLVSVACLSAAAALLMLAAGRLRGSPSLSDVFFPLVLLHAGHRENVLMSYQICFTLPVLIAAALAYLTIRPPEKWIPARAFGVGLLTALLPGFGMSGLVLAAGAALPLTVVSLALYRRGERGPALLLAAGLALTGAGAAVVAANYVHVELPGTVRTFGQTWRFATRIGAMGFGPAAEWLWPAAGVAVWAVLGGGLLGLWRRGRCDAAALAVPLGGALLVAALVWGRGWTGADGALSSRYAALILPVTFAAFLVAVGCGGTRLRAAGPAVLALLAATAWPINTADGVDQAARVARQVDTVGDDLRAGFSPQLLLERYDWQVWLADPRHVSSFEQAARVGFPAFRGYESNRPAALRTTPVCVEAEGVEFPAGTAARLTGRFVAPQHRFAVVRVRVTTVGDTGLREESFRVVKNAPNHLVVRLDGRPARVEVFTDDADGEYRLTAAEWIGVE